MNLIFSIKRLVRSMPMYKIIFLIFLLLPRSLFAEAGVIKIASSISDKNNSNYGYIIEVLNLALEKSYPKYPQKQLKTLELTNVETERVVRLLTSDVIDLFWTGYSAKNNQRMRAIPFPIYRGLLGQRLFIIHKDNLAKFQAIVSPFQLKALTACQGMYWTDTDILAFNQYKVRPVALYSSMFKMVQAKRCDYFPRSVIEAHGEIDAFKNKYPDLIIFDSILLEYPLAYLFYVNNENPELAKQLEYGLSRAIADGSFENLFLNHAIFKSILPLSQWSNKLRFKLDNPETDYLKNQVPAAYWFNLSMD